MKKNNLLLVLIIAISLLINSSCETKGNDFVSDPLTEAKVDFTEKEIKNIEDIDSYLSNFHSNNKGYPEFVRWVRAHIGTHLWDNCNGTAQCGPCPGICLGGSGNSDLVADDYELTDEEMIEGLGLIRISLIEDGTGKIIISFNETSEFVVDDKIYIPEDLNLGVIVADGFNKETFILEKGLYPVSYQYDDKGETVIDTK